MNCFFEVAHHFQIHPDFVLLESIERLVWYTIYHVCIADCDNGRALYQSTNQREKEIHTVPKNGTYPSLLWKITVFKKS